MKKLITTFLLLASFCAFGDVYKNEASDGRIYYTDTPQKNVKYTKVKKDKKPKKNTLAYNYPTGKTNKEKNEIRQKITKEVSVLKKRLNSQNKEFDRFMELSQSMGIINKQKYNEYLIFIPYMNSIIKKREKSYIRNGGTKEEFNAIY